MYAVEKVLIAKATKAICEKVRLQTAFTDYLSTDAGTDLRQINRKRPASARGWLSKRQFPKRGAPSGLYSVC